MPAEEQYLAQHVRPFSPLEASDDLLNDGGRVWFKETTVDNIFQTPPPLRERSTRNMGENPRDEDYDDGGPGLGAGLGKPRLGFY